MLMKKNKLPRISRIFLFYKRGKNNYNQWRIFHSKKINGLSFKHQTFKKIQIGGEILRSYAKYNI